MERKAIELIVFDDRNHNRSVRVTSKKILALQTHKERVAESMYEGLVKIITIISFGSVHTATEESIEKICREELAKARDKMMGDWRDTGCVDANGDRLRIGDTVKIDANGNKTNQETER